MGRVNHDAGRCPLPPDTDLSPLKNSHCASMKSSRSCRSTADSVNGAASLAVVLVRVASIVPRPVGVGIREDDRRTVAAHFAAHPSAVPVAGAQDLLSDARRTRERNEPHTRVFGDGAAGDLAAAGQHVDNPVRKAASSASLPM